MFEAILDKKLNAGRGFIKPKRKPLEELERLKRENFERAAPGLENPDEVKQMLGLAYGGVATPKRGLVDGPGSYSQYANYTQEQIDEIYKLIKNTNLNQNDIAKEVNKKIKKNITDKVTGSTVTYYGRKYYGVPARAPLNEKYKKRFTYKDRKGKLLTDILEKEDLVESIKTDVENKLKKQQIVDKYRIGGKGEKLLPSGVKQIGKGTLEEIYEELDIVRGRADLRKIDINTPENKKNLAKIKKFFNNPKLSRAQAYDKTGLSRGQVAKLLKRYKEQKGKSLIVNRDVLGIQFEGAGQERDVFKQKTKELQRFQTFLKKYKNKPLRSGTVELAKAIKEFGVSPAGFQQNLSFLRRIYKGEKRPGFKIDNEIKLIINKFPLSTALTSDVLLEAGYTPKQINKLRKAQAIIRNLDVNQGFFLNQLEHKVPRSVASELLNKGQITKAQYKDIVGKITPVTSDLNQWKKQYDLQRLINVKNYLSSNMEADDLKKFNKIENNIIKTAKKISGGYDIGKIEINPDGKINLISPDKIFKTKEVEGIGPGSRALINYYKNLKYHNILAKKYNANKGDNAFTTLRLYRGGKNVPLFNESITNDISKLKSSEDFSNYLLKNTDSALFKGLTKLTSPNFRKQILKAGKVGGTVALATLVPTMLMAAGPKPTETDLIDEVALTGKEDSILPEAAIGTGAAAIGSKFTKTDPLKKFRRFITAAPVRKGISKILTSKPAAVLGSPTAMAALSGSLLAENPSDPFGYAALTGMGASSKLVADKIKTPFLQKALTLGAGPARIAKLARFTTPVGLAATGVASLVDSARKFQKEFDALSPEEQKEYLAEQEQFAEDVNRDEFLSYAGGGIVGIRRPSAIPPEKGPQSQGLDYLRYYGT